MNNVFVPFCLLQGTLRNGKFPHGELVKVHWGYVQLSILLYPSSVHMRQLLYQRYRNSTCLHHHAKIAKFLSSIYFLDRGSTVLDPLTGNMLQYEQLKSGPHRTEWIQSTVNEIGHLTQGIAPHMPMGTKTMHLSSTLLPSQLVTLPHISKSLLPRSRTSLNPNVYDLK